MANWCKILVNWGDSEVPELPLVVGNVAGIVDVTQMFTLSPSEDLNLEQSHSVAQQQADSASSVCEVEANASLDLCV